MYVKIEMNPNTFDVYAKSGDFYACDTISAQLALEGSREFKVVYSTMLCNTYGESFASLFEEWYDDVHERNACK